MIAAAVFSLLIAGLRFAYKHPTGSWGARAMVRSASSWTPPMRQPAAVAATPRS